MVKILNIHIITDKTLKQIIKDAKKELIERIMQNDKSKNSILRSELGITDE